MAIKDRTNIRIVEFGSPVVRVFDCDYLWNRNFVALEPINFNYNTTRYNLEKDHISQCLRYYNPEELSQYLYRDEHGYVSVHKTLKDCNSDELKRVLQYLDSPQKSLQLFFSNISTTPRLFRNGKIENIKHIRQYNHKTDSDTFDKELMGIELVLESGEEIVYKPDDIFSSDHLKIRIYGDAVIMA